MGVAPYHARSCFAFTISRLHHPFSAMNSIVVFLCRNVAFQCVHCWHFQYLRSHVSHSFRPHWYVHKYRTWQYWSNMFQVWLNEFLLLKLRKLWNLTGGGKFCPRTWSSVYYLGFNQIRSSFSWRDKYSIFTAMAVSSSVFAALRGGGYLLHIADMILT